MCTGGGMHDSCIITVGLKQTSETKNMRNYLLTVRPFGLPGSLRLLPDERAKAGAALWWPDGSQE